MAETSTALRRILEKIRDDAQQALSVLGDSEEKRSLSWKCSDCNHIKHFTRPVPAEVAAPCPKCGSESFQTGLGLLAVTFYNYPACLLTMATICCGVAFSAEFCCLT
jgi:hypothetical protein